MCVTYARKCQFPRRAKLRDSPQVDKEFLVNSRELWYSVSEQVLLTFPGYKRGLGARLEWLLC